MWSTRASWAPGRRRVWRTRLPSQTSAALNLLPLTVTQLTLVCYLLPFFSPGGEIPCGCPLSRNIRVQRAVNGHELVRGPVVALSPTDTRVDGGSVADAAEVAERLLVLKRNYALLHPSEWFEGRVLVLADGDVPWRRLREILAAAAREDYLLVDFVVETDGPPIFLWGDSH